MSVEGLWTIQFSKSEEEYAGMMIEEQVNRGGVLILTGNRLYGGGISFYFVGTYKMSDTGIEVTVNAIRYNDIVPGVFGAGNEARLIFRGVVEGNTMTLHGHLEDDPKKSMVIKAERKTAIN